MDILRVFDKSFAYRENVFPLCSLQFLTDLPSCNDAIEESRAQVISLWLQVKFVADCCARYCANNCR